MTKSAKVIYVDHRHPLEKLEHERIRRYHVRRMEEIKIKNSEMSELKANLRSGRKDRKSTNEARLKAKNYRENYQMHLIAKNNEKMLDRLVEISLGKRLSIPSMGLRGLNSARSLQNMKYRNAS